MAYASYACLDLYDVMLHLDGYAMHFFRDAMLCNDDYYMQNSNIVGLCGMYGLCRVRCFFVKRDQNETRLLYTHIDWCQ